MNWNEAIQQMQQGDLSKGDVKKRERELSYYGGFRRALEEARSGIERALSVCQEIQQTREKDFTHADKLSRYIGALERVLNQINALQSRSARLRVGDFRETQ